jgi:uncharacterized membrane protein YphA (DoxX/SURF4 family)
LPPFPAWAHQYSVFPIFVGIALILTGIIISGVVDVRFVNVKRVCLYLAFGFLGLIVTCHLPYLLFIGSDDITQLQFWFGVGEALAYCGGALVMARSFSHESKGSPFDSLLERLRPLGAVFYAVLILIFGFSHFVYTPSVSTMVPEWIGVPFFWTYFVGVALIGAAVAIMFKLWVKVIAFLLAIMLFLFFLLFHIPDAIKNPYAGGGNEIVRAMVALLFCGIALVIAVTSGDKRHQLL